MNIYGVKEAQRRFETIRNAKRRRNGGKAPVTEADLQGLEDWEDAPGGIPFTAGEARAWLEYGAKLRERFPGDETLDDVVEKLLAAEADDQKIRDFVASLNERKQRANAYEDIWGNQRRNVFDAAPQELPGAWSEPAPVKWTPERTVWG
jgi:hypothetical protein